MTVKMNWHVVYTKSNYERKAALLLAKEGIETYCPKRILSLKEESGEKNLQKLLFPRWVLVYCTLAQLTDINRITGVISVVYWHNKPAVINSDEVDIIKYVLTHFESLTLKKTGIPQESDPSKEEKNIYCLPSLGYIILAEGVKESKEAQLFTLPGLPAIETGKRSWIIKNFHPMLSGLLTSKIIKLPTQLPRRLEQQ